MLLHPEELRLARAYDRARAFEGLSAEQVHLIMERGRALFKWYKAHPRTHNLISAALLVAVFAADGWTLLVLPRLIINGSPSFGLRALASLAAAIVHGWLLYSVGGYSLHEGAAHNAVFVGNGRLARFGQFVGRNICRISQADPEYYAPCHMAHHSKFGTEGDPEFLNYVMPPRLWRSLLPFAVAINFSDFVSHRPLNYTKSRAISAALTITYHAVYGWFMYRAFGVAVALVTMGLAIHVAFYLDRFRQFTEHNLMPLDNRVGARNLGVGFWGLLIGGGPWGQPCHLVHHIVASVPWYQQIMLHRYMKRLLTPHQREEFLIAPVIGFPRLLWRIVRDANRFARRQEAHLGA